ncbi:MAG TPA: putative inorganic carbon transporter subunit DabA, partial [Azonexus sp.]|nr:putative inorganic carbon transporter subunit DabA [Azonexus sp.]
MSAEHQLPIRERLAHWIEHLTHVLPAQAPIREFVHHNTLHGFQHLPFAEALAAAQDLTGARTYWPESRFRQCLGEGRIDRDDLSAALDDAGVDDLDASVVRGLSRRDVLLASLIAGDDGVETNRLDWLRHETGLGDDALFACCSAFAADLVQPSAAADAAESWLAMLDQVGKRRSWRSVLATLSGEDVLERVRGILLRHLAAHLDLGIAAWRNPAREQGFFAAWRASAGLDLAWEMDELPNVRDEILHRPDQPLDVLLDELPRLLPDDGLWYGYLERLSLELPGWSGMFLWRDRHPGRGDGTPVAMLDYLAVRVLLERLLLDDLVRRLVGWPMGLGELREHFLARPQELAVRLAVADARLPEDLLDEAASLVERARSAHVDEQAWQHLAERLEPAMQAVKRDDSAWQLTAWCRQLGLRPADVEALGSAGLGAVHACATSLSASQRGQIWLLAYERHYREQIFGALSANHARHGTPAQSSAQVVMCMDDREEGTRRHLEEIAPDVETYGAAGFFGVPMYWQGLDDAEKSALCPVVVQPRHLIREWPADGAGKLAKRHAARRERRLRWREHFFQATRHRALAGPLLTALGSLPALAALTAATLAPGWFGASLRRWRALYEGRVPTRLGLTAAGAEAATPEQPQAGWREDEQVERVAAFLYMIGLTADFAPLVVLFGHGSDSRNNPHLSAYDCGACSGRHGGPNARVFAALANRPQVRAGLVRRGLRIGDDTWFVAAEHNTCDDGVEWYDLDLVPPRFQPA